MKLHRKNEAADDGRPLGRGLESASPGGNIMKVWSGLLLVCFLAACASAVGGIRLKNETAESINNFFTERITQQEVRAKFGPPDGVSDENRQTVWIYTYNPAAEAGKLLSVTFNPERVVIDYLFAE